MKILHVSDTHGHLAPLRDLETVDVVVHSGDFLPNRTRGITAIEHAYQPAWVEDNALALRKWLGGKPLLICSGNHDFVSPAYLLRGVGIQATDLDNKRVEYEGLSFYGFPYVPMFTEEWNFELEDYELTEHTNAIPKVDVLVAHCPIYGVLDRNFHGTRCGSMPMRHFLQETEHTPRLYLTGHIHESAGTNNWVNDIFVSNAACTQRIIAL